VALIDGLRRRLGEPVGELLTGLVEALDYGVHLKTDDPESADDRVENVQELVVDARRFAERVEEPTVSAFLNEVALLTDADRVDETADRVRLLTAHNAKGLEFDVVFVAGLEEGLMPHASSFMDEEEMEEERRLFYVALTRARDEVRLSAATDRRRFGLSGPGGLSRFLGEIPSELVEELESPFTGARQRLSGGYGARGGRGAAARGASAELPGYRHVLGRILHPVFGRGEVLSREGEGSEAKLKVLFPGGVSKTIMERYVRWEESDVDF
jgi:DNA helicase-2/ATP-dependent DNA helicase PcrA